MGGPEFQIMMKQAAPSRIGATGASLLNVLQQDVSAGIANLEPMDAGELLGTSEVWFGLSGVLPRSAEQGKGASSQPPC